MEEKKMCCDSEGKELVLAQVFRGQKSGFYVVDLGAEKALTTPVATLLNDAGDEGIVRMGSLIYNVGGPTVPDSDLYRELKDGGHHIHMGVSYLELSKPHLLSLLKEGDAALCDDDDDIDDPLRSRSRPGSGSGSMLIRWKSAPAMCYERRCPSCASLGGKIYALGGSAPTSIGEVFTPECGEWKPLAPPPPDVSVERFCVSYPVLADEKNERLLVHFRSSYALYAYYPADERWDCLARRFNWKRATALVDGVVYSFFKGTRDCLVAYDVTTKSWLKVVYPSAHFHPKVCISRFPNMLHLGGNGGNVLCLANSCPYYREGNKLGHTNLQFVKFRVERTTPTEVHVTPSAITCFAFENYLSPINFIAL